MWFYKNKKRIGSILLCIVLCLSFSACAGQVSSDNTSKATSEKETDTFQQGKADISIPEEITLEFFGMNLIGANRPMWEKHIFDLNESGENDYIYNGFPIGDYMVKHSYYNYENDKNFSSYVTNRENFSDSQILFDENYKLTKIDVRADLGEEFSTSFLNIGDNVKDYFESFETGLWDKFRNGEEILADHGYVLRYSTISGTDVEYDNLQVYSSNMFISYFIKNDVVAQIMFYAIGDIPTRESFETNPTIYYFEPFKFYVHGVDIANMTGRQWMELFNCPEIEQKWMGFYDASDARVGEGIEAISVLNGTNLEAHFHYAENTVGKSLNVSMVSLSKLKQTTEDSGRGSYMSFYSGEGESFNIGLILNEECPMIIGSGIMVGDNIKKILNTYEKGLYENMVSLSGSTEGYSVGPYYFNYHRGIGDEQDFIIIGKHDERNLSIHVGVNNEMVTSIQRYYNGNAAGFEDVPRLW